jgi:diaminohydroxyphosphoribosylaminopyrimidine deaminase/5-amino-6-(5-phosphoribosylamino)uracil reductase
LCDDPRLTARGVPIRRVATRIVLDGRLRLRPSSYLVRTAGSVPTLVLTTAAAMKAGRSRVEKLRRAGVQIETCRAHKKRVDLADALRVLGGRRMTNVLVEGGPTVLDAFLAQGVADEAFVFVAPRVIGGRPCRVELSRAGGTSKLISTRRVGPDALYHLRLQAADGAA